jgi:phytoene desaturase (3,4-didehydrolycopene-forming)
VNKKKIVIVGAGIGGIAAAGRLARRGWSVTVLEKNDQTGGRCDRLVRNGYRFDTGPTLFLMPEVFAQTYRELGSSIENELELRRIDPTYAVYFSDGASLLMSGDLNLMRRQVESVEAGSFNAVLRYLEEGNRHYHAALRSFVGRNFLDIFDLVNPANARMLFDLKPLTPHYRNIMKYFRHPQLRQAFTFQNIYLGLSPFQAPATYSLLQYAELVEGVWYPAGGFARVAQSLTALAEKGGAEFRCNAPVRAVRVRDGSAAGVELESGEFLPADLVLINADLPYAFQNLLPDRAAAESLQRKRYTCSTIMFFWGMDRAYPALREHNVFLAKEYRDSFDKIFRDHTLPDEPSFYIHIPSRTDPAAAPASCDAVTILVPVGHLNGTPCQDWPALVAKARSSVLARLAQFGLTDFQHHIAVETVYEPRTWMNMYHLTKGAAFGLDHNFWQVGYFRPHNRHPKYPNIYFVGASTHPGTGLPMVLLSARLVTERITAEAGR